MNANVVLDNGATISDLIDEISDRAKNHGKYVVQFYFVLTLK
ncbi:MAG: hypothetical protein ACXW3L_05805 [Limisphaerales bacterium]